MSEHFIPGIYNYCDRWCERCPLTARCRVFAIEENRNRGDDFHAAFWKTFDDRAESELQTWNDEDFAEDSSERDETLLPELEALDNELDSDDTDLDDTDAAVDSDPLIRLAQDYSRRANEWLTEHVHDEEPTESQSDSPPEQQIGREEALDIIRWYLHQIEVKLWRALHSMYEHNEELDQLHDEDQDEEDRDEEGQVEEKQGEEDESEEDESEEDLYSALVSAARNDRDGSAKVALIGIERSLGAWTILREEFAGQDQAIRDLQRTLGQLRRLLDQRLPGARVFQRPGFDIDV